MKYILRKIRVILPLAVLLFAFATQATIPAAAFACGSASGSSKQQVLNGVDQTGTDCSGTQVTSSLQAAVTILSIVIGAAAIIMILVSGFKFLTSNGDSGKVASARSTLVYALIGVAIAGLAQFLVHFVLARANQA